MEHIKSALIDYIKEMYVIEYMLEPQTNIIIRHMFEKRDKKFIMIPVTSGKNVNVNFIWGKAKDVCAIDLYHKNFNDMPGKIMKIFRDKRSLNFYDFLIENNENVVIPLTWISEEFPVLFGGNESLIN